MSYPRATLNNFLFLAQLFISSGERTSTAKLTGMVVLFPEDELEKAQNLLRNIHTTVFGNYFPASEVACWVWRNFPVKFTFKVKQFW